MKPVLRCLSPTSVAPDIHLKNRVYFAPMGIDAASPDGGFSDEMLGFYQGIVDGGCGMVILGNSAIDASTRLQERGLCLYNESQAEALRPIIEYGRSNDCEIVVQLQHYGAQGGCQLTNEPVLSPSGVACRRMAKTPGYRVKTMLISDIEAVRQQFIRAARLAKHAGARLVQLQASNGYLLGGDSSRRLKLLIEVISDILNDVADLHVSVRIGIDDCVEQGGQTPDQIASVIHQLEDAGALIHKTSESEHRLHDGVRMIRNATELPLGFAGFVNDLDAAERAMDDVGVDLVGMTRALFADNDLVRKTIEGQANQINGCLYDGNCFKDKSNPSLDRVYCCVNPKYKRPASIQY